jgi:hypothetical protein
MYNGGKDAIQLKKVINMRYLSQGFDIPDDSKKKEIEDILFKIYNNVLDSDVRDCIKNSKGLNCQLQHTNGKAGELFSYFIRDNSPETPYRPLYIPWARHLHWGQLKLMLTEIWFLNHVQKQRCLTGDKRRIRFIYAGAAHGFHLAFLSKMFPDVEFDLYDPGHFKILPIKDKINIINDLFLDKYVEKYTNHDEEYYLLCSDIRMKPTEESIKRDQELQLSWWKKIKPEWTMFKYRLPYDSRGVTEYPDGHILIQPFPPKNSTETRIIIEKDAVMKDWSDEKYEKQLYHHNNHMRDLHYKHILGDCRIEKDGICNCYDCTWFVNCIEDYVIWNSLDDSMRRSVAEWKVDKRDYSSIYDKIGGVEFISNKVRSLVKEVEKKSRGDNVTIKSMTDENIMNLMHIIKSIEMTGVIPKIRDQE